MSGILEKMIEALEANTAVIATQNDLIGKIVAKGGAVAETTEKSTRGRKPATKDKGEEDGGEGDDTPVDAEELESTLAKTTGWLKEFSDAGDDDPENDARSEKFQKALKTLGVAKVSKIVKESDRARVDAWVDKRIAEGRITPAPKKAAAKKDEEEI